MLEGLKPVFYKTRNINYLYLSFTTNKRKKTIPLGYSELNKLILTEHLKYLVTSEKFVGREGKNASIQESNVIYKY